MYLHMCVRVRVYVRACVFVYFYPYTYMCVCRYTCVSIHTHAHRHTHLFIHRSIYQSINLSTCLPIYIYIYPAIYLKTSSIHLKVLNPFLTLGYRVLCLLCQIQEPNTCVGSGNIHEPSVGVVRSTMRDLTLETSFYLACARALSHSLSCGCPTHTPVSRREGRGP